MAASGPKNFLKSISRHLFGSSVQRCGWTGPSVCRGPPVAGMGFQRKSHFSWGVPAVGTDPKKKSGSKLLLNRTNGIQYFYWCFNFLMNLIASLSWVFKFVFKSGGDNLSSTGLVKTAEASSW